MRNGWRSGGACWGRRTTDGWVYRSKGTVGCEGGRDAESGLVTHIVRTDLALGGHVSYNTAITTRPRDTRGIAVTPRCSRVTCPSVH